MTLAVLPDRDRALADDDDGDRYVLVRVGDGWYAVPVIDVREIVKLPPVTEVPGAGAGVCGVVLVHGALLTLLDPRAALGESESAEASRARVLAVDHEGERLGLRVDEVARIVELTHSQVEPVNEIPRGASPHVLGVARSLGIGASGFAVILDVGALVRRILSEGSHFS